MNIDLGSVCQTFDGSYWLCREIELDSEESIRYTMRNILTNCVQHWSNDAHPRIVDLWKKSQEKFTG